MTHRVDTDEPAEGHELAYQRLEIIFFAYISNYLSYSFEIWYGACPCSPLGAQKIITHRVPTDGPTNWPTRG